MQKKRSTAGYLWVSLLALVVLTGLLFLFRTQILVHFKPVVSQTGNIQILVNNDTSYVRSKIIIKNRSFLKIKIDTIKYSVSIFHKTYIKNDRSLGLTLAAYESDTADLVLKIPYAAVLKDLRKERSSEDSAGYTVNVSVQYATFIRSGEMPISRVGKIKIPEPPELKVEDIRWKKLRLRSLLAEVKIKIINHSQVALSIRNLHYLMDVPGHGKLRGSYQDTVNIRPNGATFVEVPIQITTSKIGRTLLDVLTDNDLYKYTLQLNAILESKEPDKKVFNLDLIKNGRMELRK